MIGKRIPITKAHDLILGRLADAEFEVVDDGGKGFWIVDKDCTEPFCIFFNLNWMKDILEVRVSRTGTFALERIREALTMDDWEPDQNNEEEKWILLVHHMDYLRRLDWIAYKEKQIAMNSISNHRSNTQTAGSAANI